MTHTELKKTRRVYCRVCGELLEKRFSLWQNGNTFLVCRNAECENHNEAITNKNYSLLEKEAKKIKSKLIKCAVAA